MLHVILYTIRLFRLWTPTEGAYQFVRRPCFRWMFLRCMASRALSRICIFDVCLVPPCNFVCLIFRIALFLASDSLLTFATDFLRFNLLCDGVRLFSGVPLVPFCAWLRVSAALTVGTDLLVGIASYLVAKFLRGGVMPWCPFRAFGNVRLFYHFGRRPACERSARETEVWWMFLLKPAHTWWRYVGRSARFAWICQCDVSP